MMWLLLTAAILTGVSATLCLRLASQGKSIWYAAVGAGYLLAFTLLSLTLEQGMSLGVAYGHRLHPLGHHPGCPRDGKVGTALDQ